MPSVTLTSTDLRILKLMPMKMLSLCCGKIEAFLRFFAICSRYFFRFVWHLVFLGLIRIVLHQLSKYNDFW